MAKKSKITGALIVIASSAAGILLARALTPLADRAAGKLNPTASGVSYEPAPQVTTAVYRRIEAPTMNTTNKDQGVWV